MFRRPFRRGRPDWREEREARREEFRERLHEHHHRHGPHHPPFAEEAFPFWFAPGGRGPFRGRGGPGGPFGGDDPFGGDGGRRRQRRGDIKFVLLELIAEKPRHGYELIKELENRYAGFYRPSPGSVYPTLQLLEDEGNLTSAVEDGKRIYTITEAGQTLLKEREQPQEPERRGGRGGPFGPWQPSPELNALRERSMALMSSLMQVARHGTPEQVRAAQEQIDATTREIYSILASGSSEKSEGE